MLRFSSKLSAKHRAWLPVVALALLVQSLFPSGYMPGNLANGWLATLCPEGLPLGFLRQLNGGELSSHHHHGHHGENPLSDESASAGHATGMGDCQLGSALDQPLHISIVGDVVADLSSETLNTPITSVGVAGQTIFHSRSRAPPLA